MFEQCTQVSKLTMADVPPFIEVYSENGALENLEKHAIGSYTLHGTSVLNELPIYKHNCFDLYFYYDPTSNGFCISYDPIINNCILIFDVYGDLEPLVWATHWLKLMVKYSMEISFMLKKL